MEELITKRPGIRLSGTLDDLYGAADLHPGERPGVGVLTDHNAIGRSRKDGKQKRPFWVLKLCFREFAELSCKVINFFSAVRYLGHFRPPGHEVAFVCGERTGPAHANRHVVERTVQFMESISNLACRRTFVK